MENVNEAIFVIVTVLLLDHLYNNTFGLINILKTKEGFNLGKEASTWDISKQVNKLTAIPKAIGKIVEKLNTKNLVLCGLPGGIVLFPIWLLLYLIKITIVTAMVMILYIPNMIISRGGVIVRAIYSSLKKLIMLKSNFKQEREVFKNEWKRSGNTNKKIWKTYKKYVESYEKEFIMIFLYIGVTAMISVPLILKFLTDSPFTLMSIVKGIFNFETEKSYNVTWDESKEIFKLDRDFMSPIMGKLQLILDYLVYRLSLLLLGSDASKYRVTADDVNKNRYKTFSKDKKKAFFKKQREVESISRLQYYNPLSDFNRQSSDFNKQFEKEQKQRKEEFERYLGKRIKEDNKKQKGGNIGSTAVSIGKLGMSLGLFETLMKKKPFKLAGFFYRLFTAYIFIRIADIGKIIPLPNIIENNIIKRMSYYSGLYKENGIMTRKYMKGLFLTFALILLIIIFPNPRLTKDEAKALGVLRTPLFYVSLFSTVTLIIIYYYKKSVTDCFDLYESIKDLAELFADASGKKKKKKSKLRETDEEKEARLAKEYEDVLRNNRRGGTCKPDRDTVVYEKDGIDDNLDGSEFKTRFGKPWNLYPEDDKDKDSKEKRNKGTSKCEPNRDSVVYSNRGKYSGIMSRLNKIFSRRKDKEKDKDKKGKSYNCAPDRDSVVYTSKDDKISELEEELDETKRDLKKIRRGQANKVTGKQRYNKEVKGTLAEHTHSEMDGSVVK